MARRHRPIVFGELASSELSVEDSRVASRTQSSGMKSHAVLSDGGGMPGVSGELNVHAVPTRPRWANEPGEVPCRSVEGLSPIDGNS